jgi:hypothetical protein
MEGFGVLVVLDDVVIDGLDQLFDGTKTASPDGLSGDLGEPAFDLINPRTTRRGKMQNVARSASKVARRGCSLGVQLCNLQFLIALAPSLTASFALRPGDRSESS